MMLWALAIILLVLAALNCCYWFTRRLICPGGYLKPRIQDVLSKGTGDIEYDLKSYEFPAVSGQRFSFFIWLSYTMFGRVFVTPYIIRKSNMNRMGRIQMPESPTYLPLPGPATTLEDHSYANEQIIIKCLEMEVEKGEERAEEFHLPTVADFIRAYRSGKTTPIKVAEAVLDAIEDSDKADPPLRAIVQSDRNVVVAMATASAQRWKEGKVISFLDGVPIAIKEEFHCEPYECRGGTCFLPIISRDVPEAAIVQKLKNAGAVIIGMANMHEFGTGTLGSNPHAPHLTARNPYNPLHYTGGSSSGSGASVAAGFCPIAIGTDGGGSIRVPAALCGTVGLKPTFNLVDSLGVLPKTYTVGVSGPLCSSVLDMAIAMDIITKETDGDKKLVSLKGLGNPRLDGLKVGIFWDHFNDADKEITLKCRAALSIMKDLGAELVDIVIPEMEDTRVAHSITIVSEFGSSLGLDLGKFFSKVNLETHVIAGTSVCFSGIEYINSQKQRTRAMAALKAIFAQVDIIVTPAVACSAPRIRPEAIERGIADGSNSAKLMRFSFLGNLTGIPGLVVPVGYTESGLPVGMQLMGAWYCEDVLLRAGWALEQSGHLHAKKPTVFYDVLK